MIRILQEGQEGEEVLADRLLRNAAGAIEANAMVTKWERLRDQREKVAASEAWLYLTQLDTSILLRQEELRFIHAEQVPHTGAVTIICYYHLDPNKHRELAQFGDTPKTDLRPRLMAQMKPLEQSGVYCSIRNGFEIEMTMTILKKSRSSAASTCPNGVAERQGEFGPALRRGAGM